MQGRRRLQPSDTNSPNPFPRPGAPFRGRPGGKNTQGRRPRSSGRACIRIRPLPSGNPPHSRTRQSAPRQTRFHPPSPERACFRHADPRPPPRRKAAGDLTTPRRRAPAEHDKELKAATARGLHLFPFRTEKLNPGAPMILRKRESRSPPPPSVPGEPNGSPGTPFLCARGARLPAAAACPRHDGADTARLAAGARLAHKL